MTDGKRNDSMLTERITDQSSQKKVVAVQRPAESSLEIGQDNIKVYPPSHIKDAEEKIHKLKEEIEKQRREFDTL